MVCVLFMIFIHREPCDHSPRSVDVSQEIKGKNSRVLNPENSSISWSRLSLLLSERPMLSNAPERLTAILPSRNAFIHTALNII